MNRTFNESKNTSGGPTNDPLRHIGPTNSKCQENVINSNIFYSIH